MYNYCCPFCDTRVFAAYGTYRPSTVNCPSCDTVLVVMYPDRTLSEQIQDAASPKNLITTINENEE